MSFFNFLKFRKPTYSFFYGYVIVLVGFLIMLISWGTMHTYGIFLKPMSSELGWARATTSGAYSTFIILHGFLYILTGRLNDRFGPKVIITGCGLLSGLGYLLMSRVNVVWQLYLYLGVIMGVALSASFVPLASTIARWFHKRRGAMTGILVSGSGFGTFVMSPAVAWLITSYGWRNSFVIIGAISLILITITAQLLKRDPSETGEKPFGACNRGTGMVPLQIREGISANQALHSPLFWTVCVLYFCHLFGQQVILIHIVPHATDLGIPDILAANILALIGAMSVLGIMVISIMSDRIGVKRSLTFSFVIVSIALFWILMAKSIWMFYLFAIIFGFGYGGVVVQQSPIVAELFGLKSHGLLLGIVMAIAMTGGSFGVFVGGKIFDLTASYQLAFLSCALLSVIGLILVLSLRPPNFEFRRKSYI